MTTMAEREVGLPPCLLDSWNISSIDKSGQDEQLREFSATSLSKAFIKHQIESFQESKKPNRTIRPLSLTAIGSILETLNASSDPSRDIRTIIGSLNESTLRQIFQDPRLSYQAFRPFHSASPIVDIDACIIRNERFIRSRGILNQDGAFLVKLDELPSLIPGAVLASQRKVSRKNILTLPRQPMPKGGLEVLDYWRNEYKTLTINATDTSFKTSLDRITKGALNGLDWANVFMAGGIVLTTLLHPDSSRDDDLKVKDADIDLYLYNISPEEANQKIKHIYEVWKRNLPAQNKEHIVIKNAKTITFLPTYPHRRVQIVLKLLSSPTNVLLNFDIDACAVGFDGSHVLMLPRFVRALETGYSVFSMDLIWGHHLRDRRATQEARVFKYADRGFGIRFLPSYARSIQEDFGPKDANETGTCHSRR